MSIATKIAVRFATLRALNNAELADACKKAVSCTMNGEEFEVARERLEAAGLAVRTGILRRYQFQASTCRAADEQRLYAVLDQLKVTP